VVVGPAEESLRTAAVCAAESRIRPAQPTHQHRCLARRTGDFDFGGLSSARLALFAGRSPIGTGRLQADGVKLDARAEQSDPSLAVTSRPSGRPFYQVNIHQIDFVDSQVITLDRISGEISHDTDE